MARVFIVEDDPLQREIIREFLEGGGHIVILESGDFVEALALAAKARELGVNLAVVDGSLRPHSPRDGEEISAALRKEVTGIKIIGLSGFQVTFGDENLQKPVTLREFLDTVAKLGL